MTPTAVSNWQQLVESAKQFGLPVTLHGASWQDYKDLHKFLGDDSSGVRTSFCCGILQIMPTSTEHEHYIRLIERFLTAISLRTRQRISFFGSATLEKDEKRKGAEPDAQFFVQCANLISGKVHFDIAETPPDVVLEIDVYHASKEKFEIYAAFGISEFWLYDQQNLRIYELIAGKYQEIERSRALPILTADVLTRFLNRSQTADQSDVVFDFDAWLQTELEKANRQS